MPGRGRASSEEAAPTAAGGVSAIAGLGIVCEPDFLVGGAIDDGRLVRVLPSFEAMRGDIWAVYPSHRHLSLKVRLFVDHIKQWFDPASDLK